MPNLLALSMGVLDQALRELCGGFGLWSQQGASGNSVICQDM